MNFPSRPRNPRGCSGPVPTERHPCRSAGFWPTKCDSPYAFTLPGYSRRSPMRVPVSFSGAPSFSGQVSLFGPIRHHGRCHLPSSSSEVPCSNSRVATRAMRRLPPTAGHPPPARLSPAQAAPGRSRHRLPLAVTVRALTHRRGQSARPRRTSPFGRGMATFLRTLFGYHRENVPVEPEGSTSHLPPMTPRGGHPRGEPPGRPLVAGPPGLAWLGHTLRCDGSPGTGILPFDQSYP